MQAPKITANQEINPQILLVDEDKTMRDTFHTHLQITGYRVLTAGDGCEATVLARNYCPDLVITEIFMPRKDGLELIQDLRHIYPFIKIIALSKTTKHLYLKLAQLLGADLALKKPLSSAALLRIVEQQMDRKTQADEPPELDGLFL